MSAATHFHLRHSFASPAFLLSLSSSTTSSCCVGTAATHSRRAGSCTGWNRLVDADIDVSRHFDCCEGCRRMRKLRASCETERYSS